jgi:serine/threonine protein kinase
MNIIVRMMAPTAAERISAQQALNHPFFQTSSDDLVTQTIKVKQDKQLID